jgi:hypothetical protein
VFDKRRIRKQGIPAQALVLSAGRHSRWTSNDYQSYDFVLEVRPEGRAPFQTRLSEKFAIMERKPAEAETVQVKYDPESLGVVFDLAGDPRFDIEAMQARTAKLRWETHNRLHGGAVPSMPMPPGRPEQPRERPEQSGDPIEALERLARLRQSGIITDEEFHRLKAKLMNDS